MWLLWSFSDSLVFLIKCHWKTVQQSQTASTGQYLTVYLFVSYEPELHPAATYRIKHLKATVQVFSTGSITVTGIQHLHLHTLTSLTLLYILLQESSAYGIEVTL